MREERLERRRKEKAEQVAYKLEREIAMWDPSTIKSATEDPFKTLFVARVVSAAFSRAAYTGDNLLKKKNYCAYRIMTHPNRNCAGNLKCMDQLRKSSWFRISKQRNHEDMHLLSTNMNVICIVSIFHVATTHIPITSLHPFAQKRNKNMCSQQARPFQIHLSHRNTFCVMD